MGKSQDTAVLREDIYMTMKYVGVFNYVKRGSGF